MRTEIEQQLRTELLAEAERLLEAERGQAREAGYADGLAQAKDTAEQEREEMKQRLRAEAETALSALQRAHESALSSFQASVGEVAFAAVCRVVGEQAPSRAFVFGMVESICAQLRGDAMGTARLHPRDIATLHELLQGDSLSVRSLNLKVVPDESLQLGGCLIEAGSGRYEGGLEGQLRRLHAVLVATDPISGTSREGE